MNLKENKMPKKEQKPRQVCQYCGKVFNPTKKGQRFCTRRCSLEDKKKDIPPRPIGRPVLFNDEVIAKLEQAFSIGATALLACAYAEISHTAYYNNIKQRPELAERFNNLRQKPILKALHTVTKTLDDPKNAQWYLERKFKDDFALRQEITGKDGADISSKVDMDLIKKINEKLGDDE